MGSTAAIVGGVVGAVFLVGTAVALGLVFGLSSSDDNVPTTTATATPTVPEPSTSASPTVTPGSRTESGVSEFTFTSFDGLSNVGELKYTTAFDTVPVLQSVELLNNSAPLFGPMSISGNLTNPTTTGANLILFMMEFPFGSPIERALTTDGDSDITGLGDFPAFEWNSDVYFARSRNSSPLNALEWFRSNDGAAAVSVTTPTEAFTVAGFGTVDALTLYSVDATTLVAVAVSSTDNLGPRGFVSTDSGATWPTAISGTFWPTTGTYDYIEYLGSVDGVVGQVTLLVKTTGNVWTLINSADGITFSISSSNFVTVAPVGRPSTAKNGANDKTMVAFMRSTTLPGLWQITNPTTASAMATINFADRPTNAATAESAYLTSGNNRPTLYVAEADSPFEVKVWQNDQEDGMGTWSTSAVVFTPDSVINNMRIAKVPGVLFMIYQSNSDLYFTRTTDLSGLTGWTSSAVFANGAAPSFRIVPVDEGKSFGVYWFSTTTNELEWTVVPGSTAANVQWTVQE